MVESYGYAALAARDTLQPFAFERRDPGPRDVTLEILWCGICHSDMCFVDDDWHMSVYPMVPGHEIVGRVTGIGSAVEKFEVGDLAAIGCIVDSCKTCEPCHSHLENMCVEHPTPTYSGYERDTHRPTFGGYSNNYVADERYVLRVPEGLDPAAAAPLLCAGITTYSPLRHWKVGPGQKIGVVGIGGLGHVAIRLARAMGAEVTAFTTSPRKSDEARALGATEVVVSTDPEQMATQQGKLSFILDTVSAEHDIEAYIRLLKFDGTLCLVGLPPEPIALNAFSLVMGRKQLAGSPIGGIAETQEMLDFCAEHGVVADIEKIAIQSVNEAYERLRRGDVKYRFVIDMASLAG
jgi:uncharacterized zinc-type alcohol dehydrogenase-like protein